MKTIGIAGKMGCGKTILAEALIEHFDKAKILNFGDILKKEVASKQMFPLDLCYSQHGKNTHINTVRPIRRTDASHPPNLSMTVREVLQWYGTDFMRAKDPDHWIKQMQELLDLEEAHGTMIVIIADMRFPNECDFVLDKGGVTIRLNPYPGWDKHSDHASETALDDRNDFWLDIAPLYGELNETAKNIVEMLNNGKDR